MERGRETVEVEEEADEAKDREKRQKALDGKESKAAHGATGQHREKAALRREDTDGVLSTARRCRALTDLTATGCPSPSTPHASGNTYRAREAVAAVNRRRCPRDPPERSKQQSEGWGEAAQEPPPRRSSSRALTSTAGLDEEHFRLVLQARAVGVVKEPENLLQLPGRSREKGG